MKINTPKRFIRFLPFIDIVRFCADSCPKVNIGLFYRIANNQSITSLAHELTIYRRRRLTKTPLQKTK